MMTSPTQGIIAMLDNEPDERYRHRHDALLLLLLWAASHLIYLDVYSEALP